MHGEERAVEKDVVIARYADRGEVVHLEFAHLVGLIFDVHPAKLGLGELARELEESRPVRHARVAPLGAKAAHDQHG